MKRSKMVGKLLHFMSTNGFRTGDSYDSYVPLASDASDILDFLEKAGMVPPLCDLFDDGDRHSGWEPEDV